MTPTHATRAVLFVDISGSTRLYETLGDEQALAHVGSSLALLSQVCEECGGKVVKTTGDGAMCVFDTADVALRASRLMHEKIEQQQHPGEPNLGIHIGCHFGPVLENAGDLYGDAVNLAARVAGLAKVGQIITTADTVGQLSPALAERARMLSQVPVKGKQKAVTIFEFLWQDSEDLTALGTRTTDHRRLARLVLRYEGREWQFEGPGEISIGRDGTCDVVVGDRKASRKHARIEHRGDKFVLADQSSNGTWVQLNGEEAVVLRREELMLRASGSISLGHSPADAEGAPVEFSCK
jgi:class 3 adenylate cyclase